MLVSGRRKGEKGVPHLIDFASSFRFLQREDLDWRPHLESFYSNLHLVSKEAPEIFKRNITPLVVNFLSLSEETIASIVGEARFGELTRDEQSALHFLLRTEQKILAEEFVHLSEEYNGDIGF
jgi:hypothetical protein